MIWEQLKYFKKEENWGDPEKMDHQLLLELDNFRHFVGYPMVITCGTQGKHVADSLHYQGKAVDIICPSLKVLDFYLKAERFKFGGIGIYPDWRSNGEQVGGLHLDVREKPARWLGFAGGYFELTAENLKKFGAA